MSKAYSMTGWRIGYIGAEKWIAHACDKMQGQITSGASAISQRAALAALTSSQEETMKMCEAFHHRRDLILKLLQEIPALKVNKPEGAFYVFPDVTNFFGKANGRFFIKNADDLCLYLIHHAHVSVVTGAAFGDPNCIRISYATSEEKITKAVAAMKKALEELQ
jgi:aspartate aminotransferase